MRRIAQALEDVSAYRVECPEIAAWWRWPFQVARSLYWSVTGRFDAPLPYELTRVGIDKVNGGV
jgi:hypothetical protein